ncbi:MAG TPA: TlpA disulfide reductase family protein, partial [Candidatus Eremiobacteraceae bacterium]|nr:TlpA disulfide reductase family protein [Candidatus Eremiobacteraceae bacterium]
MRPKLSLSAIAAIVVLVAFTIFITWRAKKLDLSLRHLDESPSLTGQMAPDFSLPAIGGRAISLADYRGKKKIVLSFWASWCAPCRLETPALKEFYEKHSKDWEKFELLAVSVDSDRADAEAYAAESKMPFPVVLDLNSTAAQKFGVTGIPALFVIDEGGKITYGHVGYDAEITLQLVQQLGLNGNSG